MLNRCEFIGNLGKDVTTRQMQDGSPIVSFPLAVTKKWKKDGEQRESTTWINCVIFNEGLCRLAEAYLRKGSKIYIAGEWATRSYEKDGQKVYTTELVLQRFNGEIEMLDSRNAEGGTGAESPANNTSAFDDDFDDVPF